MKKHGSPDSLAAFISVSPCADEENGNSHVYGREFQSMLDGLEDDEPGLVSEKKRRLSVEQVKALEKNFEMENKLEPERKVKLAHELGLQPRQVAVWFQNRRARWKTKQLERDYGLLKANYDSLKANYDAVQLDNEALHKEIKELRFKLNEENSESNVSVKEEEVVPSEFEDDKFSENQKNVIAVSETNGHLNYEDYGGLLPSGGVKDGSSDSDSSAILNDNRRKSPVNHPEFILSPPAATASSSCHVKFEDAFTNASMSCFQFSSSSPSSSSRTPDTITYHHSQLVKMEEHNFLNCEEACNFFSDEQPPTLPWYCHDQWN